MHILYVCTGNTCRSPMAAFLTRAQIQERNLDWTVSSAGLFVEPGAPMADYARRALEGLSVPSDAHGAQPVTESLVSDADIILTMTAAHAEQLRRQFPHAAGKVYELARYALEADAAGADESLSVGYDVTDPFGRSKEAYEHCARHLQGLIERALTRLSEEGRATGK